MAENAADYGAGNPVGMVESGNEEHEPAAVDVGGWNAETSAPAIRNSSDPANITNAIRVG